VEIACPPESKPAEWDLTALQTDLLSRLGLRVNPGELAGFTAEQIEDELFKRASAMYDAKEELVGASLMREAERNIMLHIIDDQWKDHLLSMDHLKEGIGLRGYGQKDPLVEYKKESFQLFQDMMDRIEDETVRYLYFLRFESGPALPFRNDDDDEGDDGQAEIEAEQRRLEESRAAAEERKRAAQSAVQDMTRGLQKKHEKELKELTFGAPDEAATPKTVTNGAAKVGRNDPCPCGSGKKYKKCHGANS
jgi:preprotein translocase subunit SecA